MIESATTAGPATGPLVDPPPGAAAAWHTLAIADAVRRLDSDAECGLSSTEAARRLARHGPNTLTAQARTSALRILWEQLSATLMVILIVAALISAALGDYKDTAVILAIVVLNAILGFQQEYRVEQALAALKKLAVLPALALTVEPGERHSMRRAPYPPTESIFAQGLGRQVLSIGLFSAVLILGLGYGAWHAGQAGWQTLMFTILTFAQMALVLALRSERDSLFRTGLWSNKPILGAVALTIGLQLAIVYVPPLQAIFDTVALSPGDLAWSVGLSSLIFCAVEIGKWLRRRRATASPPPAALPSPGPTRSAAAGSCTRGGSIR